MVDSLPYNVADLGALDTRTNRLYMFLDGSMCAMDLQTGLIVDTLASTGANAMALDTIDDKAYAVYDEFPNAVDTAWVVSLDSAPVRLLSLPDYGVSGVLWNPLMNKVYIGGLSPPPGVEETRSAKRRQTNVGPTVLSGASGVKRLASCVVFDAIGRRVVNLKPGVYFVTEQAPMRHGIEGSRVTKFIIAK
jgi:hypothetical protein